MYVENTIVNPGAYNSRGIELYNNGDIDGAIYQFSLAIQLDANYMRAYINRGLAYHDKGEYDRAITDLNQAIRFIVV